MTMSRFLSWNVGNRMPQHETNNLKVKEQPDQQTHGLGKREKTDIDHMAFRRP